MTSMGFVVLVFAMFVIVGMVFLVKYIINL